MTAFEETAENSKIVLEHPPRDIPLRQEGLLSAMAIFGRRAISTSDIPLLQHDAVVAVQQALGGDFGAVARLTPDGRMLRLEFYNDSNDETPESNKIISTGESKSLCTYTLAMGRTIIVNNLAEEKRFDDLLLKGLDVTSAVACPLQRLGHSFGVMALYDKTVRDFRQEEIECVEAVASLLSLALADNRLESDMSDLGELFGELRNLMEEIDVLMMGFTETGRIIDWNSACRRLCGISQREIFGQKWEKIFVSDGDIASFRAVLKRLGSSGSISENIRCQIRTAQPEGQCVEWVVGKPTKSSISEAAYVALGRVISNTPAESESTKTEIETGIVAYSDESSLAGMLPEPPEADPQASFHEQYANRRKHARRSFRFKQQIGPIRGGVLPTPRDFYGVTCYDISSGGFSFLSKEKPDFPSLVVALGSGSETMYLTAEVRHANLQNVDGQDLYLVGCRYTGRVHY